MNFEELYTKIKKRNSSRHSFETYKALYMFWDDKTIKRRALTIELKIDYTTAKEIYEKINKYKENKEKTSLTDEEIKEIMGIKL
jgi:hypothetical protein